MQKINENNLYLRILKFGETRQKGFKYKELKESLNLEDWEDKIVKKYLTNALDSGEEKSSIGAYNGHSYNHDISVVPNLESIFLVIDKIHGIEESIFVLKYDAYFNYIDYLELQKAIENSKEASSQARLAMYIAVGLGLIQIIVGIIQICITK